MFCGIVFFASYLVFTKGSIWNTSVSGLTTKDGAVFLPLAIIIGTIIYHLEKNFISYAQQLEIEIIKKHFKDCLCNVFCILIVLSYISLLLFVLSIIAFSDNVEFKNDTLRIVLVSIVATFILFHVLFLVIGSRYFRISWAKLLWRTQRMWQLEEIELSLLYKVLNSKKDAKSEETQSGCVFDDFLEIQGIHASAKRLATWSDFIHCTQSCVFAWVLGSAAALLIHGQIFSNSKVILASSYLVCILALVCEYIVETHRYAQLLHISKKYDRFLRKKKK